MRSGNADASPASRTAPDPSRSMTYSPSGTPAIAEPASTMRRGASWAGSTPSRLRGRTGPGGRRVVASDDGAA